MRTKLTYTGYKVNIPSETDFVQRNNLNVFEEVSKTRPGNLVDAMHTNGNSGREIN